jgi:hypothetical protein
MLSMRENWLLVGLACAKINYSLAEHVGNFFGIDSEFDEIVSAFAQQAMKSFPHMRIL